MRNRLLWPALLLSLPTAASQAPEPPAVFKVIELRRYTTSEGARDRFSNAFESFFPEAFQQLGALVLGSFYERGNANAFTWLRGYHDLSARPIVNAAFYYGPVWKEHKASVNAILPGSDDVLLLEPLPGHDVAVLPAVEPGSERPRGSVVAQIFPAKKETMEALIRRLEPLFAGYRAGGVREAGILVTLDVPNNFPQLPVRTDGPFLVWLGLCADEAAVSRFVAAGKAGGDSLSKTDLLRGPPELLVLDPTPRSRLR
jgi:hypothetical protein